MLLIVRPTRVLIAAAAAALSVLSIAPAMAASSNAGVTPDQADQGLSHRPACLPVSGANASCRALVVTRRDGVTPQATSTYQNGYAPADLWSAYNASPSGAPGSGPTLAI